MPLVPLPGPSRRTIPLRWLVAAGALALVVFVVAPRWTVDWLWFDALGLASVFERITVVRVALFAAALLVFGLYLRANARALAAHVDWQALVAPAPGHLPRRGAPPPPALAPLPAGLLEAAGWALAFVLALRLSAFWDACVRFVWAVPFGRVDPVYGHDLGFYLFRLPFLDTVQGAIVFPLTVVTAGLAWVYLRTGAIGIGPRLELAGREPAIRHLAANASALLVALAAGFWLDRYHLLDGTRGVVYGLGFTADHVDRPMLAVMAVASLALAVAVLLPALGRHLRRMAIALLAYAGLWVVGLVLVPLVVQRFVVEPDELARETPYLERNIALTRAAYGLDKVDARAYDAPGPLDLADLSADRPTIDNVRLWDWRPLRETFRQLQRIRSYYEFADVDVDRYRIDGHYAQVMLSVRELSDTLPAPANTWVNQRLQYTHGYGLVMSLASHKSPEGSPELVVKNLPPDSGGKLAFDQPAVYYGELGHGYRLVASKVAELDYPHGDDNVYTHYHGHGGVLLDAWWKRVLFAWYEGDFNLLVSDALGPKTRIQLRRTVRERVHELAPFLRLDRDAYPVLAGGRVHWIQDAYSEAQNFPYAEPYDDRHDYIRNSVKAVVDAYDGDVRFYVVDPSDPVLQVYRHAFPALFSPLAKMSAGLRAHLRYPVDLFEIQVDKYRTYHMSVPQVFYNREDVWQAPREKYGDKVQRMAPYYVLMRLPGEHKLQFLLMTPLTPNNRDNMIGWMAARCDLPEYGGLVVYKLPKERLIFGPMQIEAMIDQDTTVSQQLSLWDQRGSHVIRGNLLVIPVKRSFLYIEPVYLLAESSDIPQLKRVIVSDGTRLAMEPTLAGAIAGVFGAAGGTPAAAAALAPARAAATGAEAAALDAARSALDAAQGALRKGDWEGFGRAMGALSDVLAPKKGEPAGPAK